MPSQPTLRARVPAELAALVAAERERTGATESEVVRAALCERYDCRLVRMAPAAADRLEALLLAPVAPKRRRKTK